jgi:hypothetical protein
MQLGMLYTAMYPCYLTNIIRLTYCSSPGSAKPLQHAAILGRIHLEYNEHVGCYLFHSDMPLTIHCSWLPTSLHYHLPPLFHTSRSGKHKYLRQVRANRNSAEWCPLYQIPQPFTYSKNADTSQSTARLRMHPRDM